MGGSAKLQDGMVGNRITELEKVTLTKTPIFSRRQGSDWKFHKTVLSRVLNAISVSGPEVVSRFTAILDLERA